MYSDLKDCITAKLEVEILNFFKVSKNLHELNMVGKFLSITEQW